MFFDLISWWLTSLVWALCRLLVCLELGLSGAFACFCYFV